MFNERKAAQVAAWFLKQSGGRMFHLKLIKLMYLAERESLRRHGITITGDRFVAMEHGPVLSTTLDCINGYKRPSKEGWEAWISDREDHAVELRNPDVVRDALDEVSDAEVDVLAASAIWRVKPCAARKQRNSTWFGSGSLPRTERSSSDRRNRPAESIGAIQPIAPKQSE